MKTSKAAAKSAAFLKQKKYRQERLEFLVEGIRAVEEAVEYGNTKMIFFVPTDDERTNALLQKAESKGIPVSETYEGYMVTICDTTTPQGIAAICQMPQCRMQDVFATKKMVLVLDKVQDPGNLGTLLRTADAAGLGGVICLEGSVDAYMPKVIRSTMGSIFHLPVVQNVSEADFLAMALEHQYETIATSIDGGTNIYETEIGGNLAVIVGNEANGISPTLIKSANKRCYIPMKGRAESLNVAIAAAIVIFQLNH